MKILAAVLIFGAWQAAAGDAGALLGPDYSQGYPQECDQSAYTDGLYVSGADFLTVYPQADIVRCDGEPIPRQTIVAGDVGGADFGKHLDEVENRTAQQQNEIDELRQRVIRAERRAAAAETELREIREAEATKKQALRELRKQLRDDQQYATSEPQ